MAKSKELMITKRNGTIVPFDHTKIENAILNAFREMDGCLCVYAKRKARQTASDIREKAKGKTLSVEEIQDMVIFDLMGSRRKDVAKAYCEYRYKRQLAREINCNSNTTDKTILEIVDGTNDYWNSENSNKNPRLNTTVRDYMAGETSTDLSRRILLTQDIVQAHDAGILHFHDMDYFAQHSHNCSLINLEDMLQNNTVISEVLIESPHTFSTACTVATQIIAQVASSQYGGQSISLAHLGPFVDVSRRGIRRNIIKGHEAIGHILTDQELDVLVKLQLEEEIRKGIQTIQYQIITLMTTNGQAPFLTLFMYLNEAKNETEKADLAMLIRETLVQTYQGVKNEVGAWTTPSFPKIIYVTQDDNVYPGSKYYDLTQLAARCSIKRLTPDYISEKKMKEFKDGNCYPVMGCRSALTVWHDENGDPKFYGRFNQGVVTLNLVDIAGASGGDMKKFWEIFDERCELCHKALQFRHKRLEGTPSDVAPILWQHGALARLKKGEKIDKLLHGGYSTISLGYAGLYETVKYMTGHSHSEEGTLGFEFGIKVMEALNDKCAQWKKEENIDYSLYGTPLETTTYKFAKKVKEHYGEDFFVKLDGADRDFITNS